MTDDLSKARRERWSMLRIARIGISVQRTPRWEVKIWFGGRLWFCLLCAWALISTGTSLTMAIGRVGALIVDGEWRTLALFGLVMSAVSWIVALCCIWLTVIERAVGRVGDGGGDDKA